MKFSPFISFLLFILLISAFFTGNMGCANIVPPQGGFRDSIPPALVRATPADSTINFTGNRINFSFDEYIDVDNFQQNVIITPIPKVQPTEIHRLNTISLRLKDTLEANTTYTINFGNAIKDVNEGNVMKDFVYIFSTGPAIDSLSFRGNVLLAETGQVDSNLTVILHRNPDDSAVRNERPRYVTKLDHQGNFVFRNLPPGTFYVYALEDQGRQYRYYDTKNLFAFADSPVIVNHNTRPVTLYAYAEKKASEATGASTSTTGRTNVTDRRLKFQTNLANGSQDLNQKFSFVFERPLRDFDSTKVRFTTDTTFTPVTGYSWTIDSSRKKVTLNYSWPENTLYHLILSKDFAKDTLGFQLLKADTIKFRTMERSDYGELAIRFRNLDFSKNPVVQFVMNGEVTASYPLTSANFSQSLFSPGEYELRILYDANKNGKWDPGHFFGKHQQPELVKPITRKITVKANWQNEFDI
jgi:hypothetical protein